MITITLFYFKNKKIANKNFFKKNLAESEYPVFLTDILIPYI